MRDPAAFWGEPDKAGVKRVRGCCSALRLLKIVTEIAIETSGSAMTLGMEVLQTLGLSRARAQQQAQLFYVNNQCSIHVLSTRFQEDDQESFLRYTVQM